MSDVAQAAPAGAVLVIGPDTVVQAVQGGCRDRYGIDRVDDALAALERLSDHAYAAVFAWTGSLPSRGEAALEALRELLGPAAKLFLVAGPEDEPLARGLLSPEVDDYLIWPLRAAEVSAALRAGAALAKYAPEAPGGAPAGLGPLAEAIDGARADPGACLDRLAALVADWMGARGCTIEAGQTLSVCGEAIGDPVLDAPIDLGEGRQGRLAVGPRRTGSYSPADAAGLEQCAAAVGALYRLATEACRWRQEALTDELTALPNRRGLMVRLPDALDRARRQHNTVTLLMFDIDNFKHYNDEYGHAAGDEILRETGRLFSRHCRSHDIVARYGGDEFVVVFLEPDEPRKAGSKPPRDVLAVLGRFKKSLERHEFKSLGPEARGRLTISGGLITFPWDAYSPEDLIGRADEALLLAKRQGKNRIWLVGQGPR